jgi:hypothetical protein
MLNLVDISIANKVTESLDAVATIFIQSKSGTDIAELDAVTPAEANLAAKEEGGVFSPMDLVEGTSRKNVMGVYEHDIVLEKLTDKAWNVINQRATVTRDRAIPMATNIIAGLNKVYSLSYTEANVYTIEEVGLPEGVSSPLLTRLIDQYADSTFARTPITQDDTSPVRLDSTPEVSEGLSELFKANYIAQSEGIVTDGTTLAESIMTLFYNTVNIELTYTNVYSFALRLMTADLLLTADELPAGIVGYHTAITNFLNGEAAYAAKQLKLLSSIRDTRLARKDLIASIDHYGLKITVNSEVYHAWLGMGGTAEALIGYVVVNGNLDNHYDTILDNIAKYTEAYNVAKLKLFDSIESNQLVLYKKNLPYQLQAALADDGFSTDEIKGIVDSAAKDISAITTPTGDRFYMSILAIISNHVYPGLDIYPIALEMNRIGNAIPGISPEQAIGLVCSDMLLTYIASQYEVTRVG